MIWPANRAYGHVKTLFCTVEYIVYRVEFEMRDGDE
jgi:hypothetical protein